MPIPRHRLAALVIAPLLAVALLVSGCSGDNGGGSAGSTPGTTAGGTASPTGTQEKIKFAKAKFVANAGLAAGATYQWLYKPYKEGKFKKGANGRTATLVKGALAGAFAYNRLKAAIKDAQADPALSKAIAPLTAGVDKLKQTAQNIRKGENPEGGANQFQGVIDSFKEAGKSAGAEIKEKVPSLSQLNQGG